MPSKLNQNQQDSQGDRQEQRGEPTQARVGDDETEEHKRVAREVKATQGKHPPPPTTLAKHGQEYDNKTGACEAAHANTLAVEPLPNNTVPGLGEYHPPPEHLTHDTANEHDTHTVSLSHQEESGGDNTSQLPKRDMIGQLVHELDAQQEGHEDWAREMEMELKGTTHGEYIQAGYMDPTPAPPPLLPGPHHNPHLSRPLLISCNDFQ